MTLTDRDYMTLLDAKRVVQQMREEPLLQRRATDTHCLMVLLLNDYIDQVPEEQEIEAPF